MGLKFQGSVPSVQNLTPALAQGERAVDSVIQLLEHLETAPSVPKTEAKLRQQRNELDAAIASLEDLRASSKPAVREAATKLLELTKHARRRLEDGVWPWVLKDDLEKAKSSDVHQPPDAHLGAVEAILKLIDVPSLGEVNHALRDLSPLINDERLRSYVDELRKTYNRSIDDKTVRTVATSTGVAFTPLVTGLLLTGAAFVAGAPPSAVGGGVALSLRVGKRHGTHLFHETLQRLLYSTGVNRLSGVSEHDLVLLHDRVRTGSPFEGRKGAELLEAAWLEANLIEHVLEKRTAGRQPEPSEHAVIAAFTSLAMSLRGLGGESAERDVRAASQELLRAISGADLEKFPPLSLLLERPVDPKRLSEPWGVLVGEIGRLLVQAVNPPLSRFLRHLEGQPAEPLGAAELSYLRHLVKDKPSFGKVVALSSHVMAGRIAYEHVWPGAPASVRSSNGSFTPAALRQLRLELEGPKQSLRERLGERVLALEPYTTPVIGSALCYSADGLGAIFTAIVVSMGLFYAVTGFANKAIQKGATERLGTGTEPEMASASEYQLVLERVLRDDMLGKDSAELAAGLRSQADQIDLVIAILESDRRLLIQQAQAGSADAAQAIQLDDQLRGPIYGGLRQYAAAARDLAARATGDDAALRRGYAQLRSQLTTLFPLVAREVLASSASPEVSEKARYLGQQVALLNDIEAHLQGGPGAASAASLCQRAAALDNLRRRFSLFHRPRGPFVKTVAELASRPATPDDLRKVVATHKHGVSAAYKDELTITAKRATRVAQQVLDAMWSRVFPMLGLREADNDRLVTAAAKAVESTDADGYAVYRVEGKVKGSQATFAVDIDAVGSPVLDMDRFSLDVGAERGATLARHALVRYLSALHGRETPVGAAKPVSSDEKTYVFDIPVGDSLVRLPILKLGFVLPARLAEATLALRLT
jgi:hypothetical protein